MSRAESISLLKNINEINTEIDKMKEKKYELQKKIEDNCDHYGHFWICTLVREEYDLDDEILGTKQYFKCLFCGKTMFEDYTGLYSNQVKNGIYNCKYLINIANSLINSNIEEANEFFKEQCKYDVSIDRLQYMSKILKEIGYTIDLDTKSIIPIKEK